MKQFFALFFCLSSLFLGLHFGRVKKTESQNTTAYPIQERKTFVFLVYAYNQAEWVEKTLRSILEQEYDYYRIVFIDDASQDKTFQIAKAFLEEKPEQEKTLWIRNEKKQGLLTCLYQGVQNLLDREIAIPLLAPDSLAHSGALSRMNQAFQNPNTWFFSTEGILYPSYERTSSGCESFYAAIVKQMTFEDVIAKGNGDKAPLSYLKLLDELIEEKQSHTDEILLIKNESRP